MTAGNERVGEQMAAAAFGLMAVGLAAGLEFPGLLERMDEAILAILLESGLEEPMKSPGPVWVWGGAGALALGVAAVMLNVAGTWRRVLIWGLTCALVVMWAPVLLLAARRPEIGAALIAVLGSGFFSLIYTMSHRMAVDSATSEGRGAGDGTR